MTDKFHFFKYFCACATLIFTYGKKMWQGTRKYTIIIILNSPTQQLGRVLPLLLALRSEH